jgi:release factor glutamine methyltransferase
LVDVGTGTGAVALAIARERPDATVLATDVSDRAVGLARENADALELSVEVFRGSLLSPLPAGVRGAVDLVVSNPPYLTAEEFESLPPEVKAEPLEALVGGTDVHRRLAEEAAEWLRPGGWLVMEIGAEQGPEVRAALAEGFLDVGVTQDLAGRDRVIRGRRPPGE